GPDKWAADFPVANGPRQSPINIVTQDARYDPSLKALKLRYDPSNTNGILNNGHSFQVDFVDVADSSSKKRASCYLTHPSINFFKFSAFLPLSSCYVAVIIVKAIFWPRRPRRLPRAPTATGLAKDKGFFFVLPIHLFYTSATYTWSAGKSGIY
ncbi:hypothetical protein LDENG_00003380, partial [Lucifuga dentata]